MRQTTTLGWIKYKIKAFEYAIKFIDFSGGEKNTLIIANFIIDAIFIMINKIMIFLL